MESPDVTPFVAAYDASVEGKIACVNIDPLQAAKWGWRIGRVLQSYWEFLLDL